MGITWRREKYCREQELGLEGPAGGKGKGAAGKEKG